MNPESVLAPLVGLVIAFGGTALLASPASRVLGPAESLRTRLLEQLVLWLIGIAVAVVALEWEGKPPSFFGLRPFHWSSIAWGLALAWLLIRVFYPLTLRAFAALGLRGFDEGMAQVLALPLWFRIIAVVTAGVVEEFLFRGYAVGALAQLTGSVWIAAGVSVAAFALLHWPLWGAGPVLSFVFSGGLLTAFFVWRQDLLANVVAHVVVDGMGFVVAPWRQARRAAG